MIRDIESRRWRLLAKSDRSDGVTIQELVANHMLPEVEQTLTMRVNLALDTKDEALELARVLVAHGYDARGGHLASPKGKGFVVIELTMETP